MADGGIVETGGRQRRHSDRFGDLVVAGSVGSCNGEGHTIRTCLRKDMGCRLSRATLPVTEIPLVAGDGLSRWISGRGAGELRGAALTSCSEVEVGDRLRVDDDFRCGTVGLRTNGNGAGVGASHSHGTVWTCGVLLA